MTLVASKHLWRNRLARSAVNRKVGGSSPPRCDFLFLYIFYFHISLLHTGLFFTVAS